MNIEPLGYTAKSAHVQGVVSGKKPWMEGMKTELRVTCTLHMLSLSTHDRVIESSMPFNSFVKEGQHCQTGLDRLTSIQQVLSASLATNPFVHVTMSDIEEATPRNFKSLTDLSDNEIEIESE
ncbi:unnamed protein product [Porites evermanni]|uniref:Uncharacterized protein n=1 Tax=Porites evermanni TaxID=104178 RepID=A0ABN8LME4_9CNID|nr:unnamed protein product [Porites evermanni]